MKYGILIMVAAGLCSGVIVGSQVRPTLRYPTSVVRRYGKDESPVRRLALALVEVGDAVANLSAKSNCIP